MKTQRVAVWCLLVSILGIGLSAFLVFLHLGLMRGELLGGVACGGGGAFNCHAVTGSSWSQFLGIPLALWGLIGYITVLALSLLSLQSREWETDALTLLWGVAVVFVTVDAVLFSLMVFVIRFLCVLCLLTYALNLSLLLATWRWLRQTQVSVWKHLPVAVQSLVPSSRRPATLLFWGILLVGSSTTMGLHAATTFVSRGTLGSLQPQMREFVEKQPRVAVDISGDPSLGPVDARFQVVEFSDFLCAACNRMSKLNTIILANHRDDTRFVFKHFPLDTTCNNQITRLVHPGACDVAAASECAHRQGKFWPFHDRIFGGKEPYKPVNLEADARDVGLDMQPFQHCMASGEGMTAVKRDIAQAGEIGVTSTPTFVINGVRIPGILNPSTFEDLTSVLGEASTQNP